VSATEGEVLDSLVWRTKNMVMKLPS